MIVIQRGGGETHPVARTPDLEVRLDGNHQEIVLRLAEYRALHFRDAHYFKLHAFHRQGLSDRTGPPKKLFLKVVPDECDVHVAIVLDLGEETSLHGLQVGDHPDIRGRTLQADAFRYLRSAVHRDTASGIDADLFGPSQALSHQL